MSMTELKTSFPTVKLEALHFYMGEKEQSIENELEDYLDRMYEKVVPLQVRKYLESRMETAPASMQTLEKQTSADGQSTVCQNEPAGQIPTRKKGQDLEAGNVPAAKDIPVRTARRQKEQTPADQSAIRGTAPITEEPSGQEEGQGMSMGMSMGM